MKKRFVIASSILGPLTPLVAWGALQISGDVNASLAFGASVGIACVICLIWGLEGFED